MLKKYLYVGVLVGAIVLAGCSISEEPEDQVQEKEDISNGQAIEDKNLSDTNKKEVVSEVPLELTKEQKEDYYKQYVEIVEEINAEGNGAYTQWKLNLLTSLKKKIGLIQRNLDKWQIDRATWEFTSKNFGGDHVE